MPIIRPITDLRNTNEISEICHARQEPVFITKNGYGDMVVMSIETYEAITENGQLHKGMESLDSFRRKENAAIDTAISEAEAEFEQDGQLFDASETMASLRRKHFG